MVHVGDNLRRDYEGAQRVGMNAMLVDRAADERGLRALPPFLEMHNTNKPKKGV